MKSNNKIIFSMILLLAILFFPQISALDIDNIVSDKAVAVGDSYTIGEKVIPYNDLWAEYKPIEIKNWLGLGEVLYKDVLTKHSDSCGYTNLCEDIWEVELTKEGALLDDMYYKRQLEDGSWIDGSVRWNNFYYWGNVPDYTTECSPAKLTEEELKNETKPYDSCIQVESGSHEDWVQFNIGDRFSKGYYKVKSVAEKRPDWIIDYIPVVMGKPLTSRATWGNISTGSQAEVILNSPANNSIQYSTSTTNASANVTNGAYLTNVTLYDNSTGSWGARNSTSLVFPSRETLVSHWDFEETSGTVIKDNIGQNNLSTSGSPVLNFGGRFGKAVYIPAGNNYLISSNNVIGLNSLLGSSKTGTINLWYFSNSSPFASYKNIFGLSVSTTSSAFTLSEQTSDELLFSTGNGGGFSFVSGFETLNNSWIMYTFVYNNGIISSYQNGIFIANTSWGGTTLANGKIYLGNEGLYAGDNNAMIYDEMSVYNNSLTLSNIQDLYNFYKTNYTQTFTNTYPSGSNILWNYLWNYQFCDSDGACGFSTSNYTFSIDPQAPTIVLNYPTALINYGAVNGTLQLNFTATDSNLASCWYDYNGTNVSVAGCLTGVANLSNITLSSKKNVTIYANDTAGNTNTSTFSWDYKIFENSRTFLNETIEGSQNLFYSILDVNSNYSISSANLVYNGSLSAANFNSSSGKINLSKNSFIIPEISTDTNLSFYWNILLSDSTIINTSSSTQLVKNLGIDNCSVFTNRILNITTLDEELQTPLNSIIEVAINLLPLDRSKVVVSLGKIFTNNSNFGVCLNINITNGSDYSMDTVIKYYAQNYATEYYNIQNYILNSVNQSQNVTLFILNSSVSTDFQLTFTGTDFLPAPGVLVFVNRQYIPENVFKTVELPITDSNGQTVLHLVTNNVLYNLVFMKDGIVLKTYSNIRAYCNLALGSCTLNLNAISDLENQLNYNNIIGIVYSSAPTFNSTTNLVSFSFSSFNGSAKNVLLEVKRNDIFGNISICNNSLNSISGTVQCSIDPNIEDTSLETFISVDGTTWLINIVNIDSSAYGSTGYVLWFILTLAFVLMLSRDKNSLLISLLISYVSAVSVGLIVGGIIGAGSAGIWIIIVTVAGLWKLNKNKFA